MPSALYLAALAGGGILLYRHLNPGLRLHHGAAGRELRVVEGRTWVIQHRTGFFDVSVPPGQLGATRETVILRVASDTNKVLAQSGGLPLAVEAAIHDLGLVRT